MKGMERMEDGEQVPRWERTDRMKLGHLCSFAPRKMGPRIFGGLAVTAIASSLCVAPVMASSQTSPTPAAAQRAQESGYLMSYSGTKLIPASPAPLPSGASATAESSLPTVTVPFTAGFEVPKPPAPPKEVMAPVPASVASHLAAYYITLYTDETMYLVAPRGLKGKMEIGADGSAGLSLRGPHMKIELDHAGGAPVDIWSIAAPFYATARKDLTKQPPVEHVSPLRHATLQYTHHRRLVKFAFNDTLHRYVAGYTLYLPSQRQPTGTFSSAAQFTMVTDKTDEPLARWTMASALDALYTIGDPFLLSPAIPSKPTTLTLSRKRYSVTLPTTYAGDTQLLHATNRGTLWLDPPRMMHPTNLAEARPLTEIPSWDWMIQLSSGIVTNLDNNEHTRTLVQIGPVLMAGLHNPMYVYPNLLQNQVPNWALYTTTMQGLGMAQAYGNDLYAVDLKTGKVRHLTMFTDAGGTFFSLGNNGDVVVWDQSGYKVTHATMVTVHNLREVNLNTGMVRRLPNKDLHGETVRVRIDGHFASVRLKNVFH